jgi:hypothetical protein
MSEIPSVKKWTNDEIRGEFPAVSNLQDVVGNIEEKLWKTGRVVCEVRVNGMFFSEDDEKKFASTPLDDIAMLEIRSRSQEDLINDTLGSFYEILPKLEKLALETSVIMRGAQSNEVGGKIKEILDATCWLTDALKLIKYTVFEIVKDEGFEQDWNNLEKQYTKVITEVLKAFEINDWVLLADVFEYDLTTVSHNWLELFRGQDKLSP